MHQAIDEDARDEPEEGYEEELLLVEDAEFQAMFEREYQRRQWLRTIKGLLEMRSHESDPSGRVQLAYDLFHIAACERGARILRSDLEGEEDV